MQQINSFTSQSVPMVVPPVSGRPKFSVLISVYANDSPKYFDQAMVSITFEQTLMPDEVVLVVDGPVNDELSTVIGRWEAERKVNLKAIWSPINLGLSRALNLGLQHCSHAYVARMDSDDVSIPTRFEQQMGYLQQHPDVTLLGGWYQQFDRALETCLTDRKVPQRMPQLVPYSKTRTPFNHVTAIFKRECVMNVGGYPIIDGYSEDWWVALRLIKAGHVLQNLPQYLVKVRGDEDFIGRRGGWNYIKHELKNLNEMRRQELITTGDLIKNVLVRTPVRLLPLRIRTLAYNAIRRV